MWVCRLVLGYLKLDYPLGETRMLKNLAGWERLIRILVGFGLIATGYMVHSISDTAQLAAIIIGAVLVITAIIGYCPIWHVLGLSTRKKPQAT